YDLSEQPPCILETAGCCVSEESPNGWLPAPYSMGDVRLGTSIDSVGLTFDYDGGYSVESLAWSPGDQVWFTVSGDQVHAFSGQMQMVQPLIGISPDFTQSPNNITFD